MSNWQDIVGAYFIYKVELLSNSAEFQRLGWVDTDWWFRRIGGREFSLEISLGAAVRVCREGLFEMFAEVECPSCKIENRYKENPKVAEVVNELPTTGKACQHCGHHVSVPVDQIKWVFKLSDSLIKDPDVYFNQVDDMEELRKESYLSKITRWMGFKK